MSIYKAQISYQKGFRTRGNTLGYEYPVKSYIVYLRADNLSEAEDKLAGEYGNGDDRMVIYSVTLCDPEVEVIA